MFSKRRIELETQETMTVLKAEIEVAKEQIKREREAERNAKKD